MCASVYVSVCAMSECVCVYASSCCICHSASARVCMIVCGYVFERASVRVCVFVYVRVRVKECVCACKCVVCFRWCENVSK